MLCKRAKGKYRLDTNRLHACDSENPSIGNDFEGFPPISYLSEYQYTCPLIEVHDVVSTYFIYQILKKEVKESVQ